MSKEELKACPFCGADGEYSPYYNEQTEWEGWQAGCSAYCCLMDPFKNKIEAINAWNTRTEKGEGENVI